MKERLEALGRRVERVALDPDAIEAHTLFRVARPLLAAAGWRARVRFEALEALVGVLGMVGDARAAEDLPAESFVVAAVVAAVRELEANVDTVERAAILRRRAPVAYAAWLRRVWELVCLADRVAATIAGGAGDLRALRREVSADPIGYAAPLSLVSAEAAGAKPAERLLGDVKPAKREAVVPTRDDVPVADADLRVVELELSAIDHLLSAARAEQGLLGRRRRLLVAARQRLLEAAAALPLERQAVKVRADWLAREIARIDRFETVGLSVDAGLVHQARHAIDRGDPRRVYAALAALDGIATGQGDAAVSAITSRAIAALWGEVDPRSPEVVAASLQRSAVEMLGEDVVGEIGAVVAAARDDAVAASGRGDDDARWRVEHFDAALGAQLTSAAVAVDGCFEVGGALAPIRVTEEERVLRQVRHPTQDMTLVPAREVEDIADAVVSDPRTVLLDLAAGRLLARRFVREESRPRQRVMMKSEVRVYVLDGSGSMKGPRGRVRDAIMVAELATLMQRLRAPGTTRCTLLFRYFDTELEPVTRVSDPSSVKRAIEEIVGSMREGGTDIQKALLASLEQIAEARALDPDLARAQIVLVTDGDAPVDEAAVAEARAALEGLPIGVSVVALGLENPALRGLVARQRARGEPAFYHFFDDAQLDAIVRGQLDVGLPVHLPDMGLKNPHAVARELSREVGPLVEELAALERQRDLAALEQLDLEAQARREAGVDEGAHEGERARIEALARDRSALLSRFARWFPEPSGVARGVAPAMPPPRTPERDDVEATLCALASVAEVVALLGGSDLARRADAIELLERLLPDARLSPARYRAVLRDWPGAVAEGLIAVREAVRVT